MVTVESQQDAADARLFSPSDNLSFETTKDAPLDFVQFIENIRWGTSGVLYRMKNYSRSLEALPPRLHLSLRRRGRLVATRIAIPKWLSVDNSPLTAFYHSLLSVDPREQGKGYGRLLARYTVHHLRQQLGQKGLLYAYIEEGNSRSVKIATSLGYRAFGQFHGHVISRLFPRNSTRVFQPKEADLRLTKRYLENLYRDHALTDFDVSLRASECWALYENGLPVAGVQVLPQRWQIERLPSLSHSPAFQAIFQLPVLSSLLFSRSWRFLKVGNIYFQHDRADMLFELLDAVLYRHQMNYALIFVDHRSPVYQELHSSQSFGLLDAFARTKINVWGFFHHLSRAESSYLHHQPLAISVGDI